MKEFIQKLVEGTELTRDEAYQAMQLIMRGEATQAQIGAYITALRIRIESPEVIAGSVQAMRENFTPIPAPPGRIIDTCGTGGDGANTFNISTAAALITAACGAVVAKHGNRSVSSRSGSADVLGALGVNTAAGPETMQRCLEKASIAFLFAPTLHPAMKHAIGPRREIGIRTIFNILGPLSNPAGAKYGILGVYEEARVRPLAEAALALGAEHLFVVHGSDGLDEITLTGSSHLCEVRNGTISEYTLTPEEVGLSRCSPQELAGGDPDENARTIRAVLEGTKGPARDIACLNAAPALVAAGLAESIQSAIPLAQQAIDEGKALNVLETLIEWSRE